MDTERLSQFFAQKMNAWHDSQKGQTDGYEYERSFVEVMREVSHEAFQASLGEIPSNRNKKNS